MNRRGSGAGRAEVFPKTPRTMVLDALAGGDAQALPARLMELYRVPLEQYFAATSFRHVGRPTDVVAGYFASRFSNPGWLDDWRGRHEVDGIPLRRWLVNGLNFYLLEEHRRGKRGPVLDDGAASDAADESDALAAFERAAARRLVARALERTREGCEADGQQAHFDIFVRHVMKGQHYHAIHADLGIEPQRSAGMVRTASARFRRALAGILVGEGADPERIDDEIAALMEALAR